MRQAAAALAKAAEQGIVHRDIKPENIMLTRSGEVKVADFGLARFTGEGDAVDLTQVGMTLGTPLYMSPEQVEGKTARPAQRHLLAGRHLLSHALRRAAVCAAIRPWRVAVQHLKKQPRPLEELARPAAGAVPHHPQDAGQDAAAALCLGRRNCCATCGGCRTSSLGDEWPDDLPGWETAAGNCCRPRYGSSHAASRRS